MKKKENIAVLTIKSWNIKNYNAIKKRFSGFSWHLIKDKKNLTEDNLKKINPKYIFIPHWSWIVSSKIYDNYPCVVFHMTDLPFGRGGSPLQNLLSRGIYDTKISALKVSKGIDDGDIYIKEPLNLEEGKAEEIYKKASDIIFHKMIPFILKNNPSPRKQKGKVIKFKRRTKEECDIANLKDLKKVYDYIRMLDAEGYPNAFIKTDKLKIEFKEAKYNKGKIKTYAIITLIK